jgi:hypothetical protein
MLIELVFDVRQRELGAPDWDVQLREDPRQGSDMIFVTVGEDNSSDALTIFDEIGNIGYNNVDAQKFGLREHQAGVDDDDVIPPADGHAVHTELAQAPKRDNLQFSS